MEDMIMGTNNIYELLSVVEEIKNYFFNQISFEYEFEAFNYECQMINDHSWILTPKAKPTETTISIEKRLDSMFDTLIYIHSASILDLLSIKKIPFPDVYLSNIRLSPSILYKVYSEGDYSYRVEI